MVAAALLLTGLSLAGEHGVLRAAVEKSLPRLMAGAEGSREERPNCYTCHNQGLPVMALTLARTRGFKVDRTLLAGQQQFTIDFLKLNEAGYLGGKGQGGGIDTAGSALWMLERSGWPPDAATAAVAEYLLRQPRDADHWRSNSKRPPTQQSEFTATFLALRSLKAFGTVGQKERIDARFEQARQWLVKTKTSDTEDRVFHLLGLDVVGAKAHLAEASRELQSSQNADGGWSQTVAMTSDAYATGSALVALHEAGGVATTDAAYRRGLRYLLSIQQDDGTWHVATRSKPIQTHYESGYPHGKDQFISISAASWATLALVHAMPAEPKR